MIVGRLRLTCPRELTCVDTPYCTHGLPVNYVDFLSLDKPLSNKNFILHSCMIPEIESY
jgi:hypothetical protein